MKSAPQKPFDDLPDLAMIQLRQLLNYRVIPFSAATIWRKCRSGEFPAPFKVSVGITAWKVGDIRQYLEATCNVPKGGAK